MMNSVAVGRSSHQDNTFESSSSNDHRFSKITTQEAIARWSLTAAQRQTLQDMHFGPERMKSIGQVFSKNAGQLIERYQQAKLPLDKFKSIGEDWKSFETFAHEGLFSKHKTLPAFRVLELVNNVTRNELVSGFFTTKSPKAIQKGIVQQISDDIKQGFIPVIVESDSLLKDIPEMHDINVPKHEFYRHDGELQLFERNDRFAVDAQMTHQVPQPSSTLRFLVSHLKSGLNEKQTDANFAQMELMLGCLHEQLHFSDMNVDVTNHKVLQRICALAEAKGFVPIIPDRRYSKIRLGNNNQPLKEAEHPLEAESMIVFADKKLMPQAEKHSLLIDQSVKLSDLKFPAVPIFSDELPGDHHPVRLSLKVNGQKHQFGFYNLLNSKDGRFPFYDNDELTSEDVETMNDIHTQVKRQTIDDLQAIYDQSFSHDQQVNSSTHSLAL